MNTLNTSLVSRGQLGNVLDALSHAVATRADLADYCDVLERELPALIAKNSPAPARSAPFGFVLDIVRDEFGQIVQLIARPDPNL